jgi:hypothetical protein
VRKTVRYGSAAIMHEVHILQSHFNTDINAKGGTSREGRSVEQTFIVDRELRKVVKNHTGRTQIGLPFECVVRS